MPEASQTAKEGGQSFASFDRAGRLLDWNEAFVDEFAAAEALIAPGASLRALLASAFALDEVARVDMAAHSRFDPAKDWSDAAAVAAAEPRTFDYRNGAGRVIRVSEDRTKSGGLVRTAWDVTDQRGASAAFAVTDEEWCLDGDPTAEGCLHWTVRPDTSVVFQPVGEDIRRVWGLTDDFDLTDHAALFSRLVSSPAEAERQNAMAEAMIATLQPTWFDSRIRDGANRLRWLRSSLVATPGPNGDILVENRVRDVTRQRLSEDQLVLLRTAVTHATDSIQIVHTTPDGLSTTAYANPAFERTMGWSADDLMGRPIAAMTGWENVWEKLLALVEHDDETAIEIQASRRDGALVWLEASAKLLERGQDGAIRWVVVARNIGDRRKVQEDLLRAKEQAEAANVAKSEFLANMSHEIRTPMNGVIGMSSLLLRGDLRPEQRTFAEAIRTSADSLLDIINNILDISKLEAGKVELESIDFSLEKVVEDVVELLAPRALEQGVEVVCHLDDLARRPLRGDPTRVRQILLNLLSNSLKFTERGFVSVQVTSERGESGLVGLRIEVSDTGIGLTPEAKGKLFQKFQQADGSITRRFGGTGLGLSICRELVELMGGAIGVEDRRGGGSTFWVEIELAAGLREIERGRPANLRGVRILVVDDLEINRTIFRRQLEEYGAIVREAASGAACLAALAQADADAKAYDLVLMDHMMPGMAGDQVAELIRANADLHQPRLVLASSMGVPLSTDRAAHAGFDAFLTKPVRHKMLVDCLAGLMAQGETAASAETSAASTETRPLGQVRVLLAEDNAINTLLATTLLEAVGYSVETVVNGAQAVEAAQRSRYDLILMDVHMPLMDGLEASRRIRALAGAAGSVPIVAMTANAMKSDREACLAAGMSDFVSKPIDADAFLAVVARYVEQDDDNDRQADPRLSPPPPSATRASA